MREQCTAEVFDMVRTRKLKENVKRYENGYTAKRKNPMEFRPHCYVQRLALAEAKRFDGIYASSRASVLGEDW
jgi:hypothetical protein